MQLILFTCNLLHDVNYRCVCIKACTVAFGHSVKQIQLNSQFDLRRKNTDSEAGTMPLSLLVLLFAMFHVHVCSKCRNDRSYCNITTYEHERQDAKVLDALTAQSAFLKFNGDVYVSIFRCISCMMMIICILLTSNCVYNTEYVPTISS